MIGSSKIQSLVWIAHLAVRNIIKHVADVSWWLNVCLRRIKRMWWGKLICLKCWMEVIQVKYFILRKKTQFILICLVFGDKKLCNIARTSGTVPLDWQTGVVVPLFKKGDLRVCSIFVGITLLSFPGKVYSGVVERRVRWTFEPRIHEEKCGFYPGHGKGGCGRNYAGRSLSVWQESDPGPQPWIDYRKAYDSMPHTWCWEYLALYNVNRTLRTFIKNGNVENNSGSKLQISCTGEHQVQHITRWCDIPTAQSDNHKEWV